MRDENTYKEVIPSHMTSILAAVAITRSAHVLPVPDLDYAAICRADPRSALIMLLI